MYLSVEPLDSDAPKGTPEADHLAACLAACPLPAAAVWRSGEWEDGTGGSVVLFSGFSVLAAGGPLPDFATTVAAALGFLGRHSDELAEFSRHPSVRGLLLLVPASVTPREAAAVRVPRRLAEVAATAGVRVQVSGRGA